MAVESAARLDAPHLGLRDGPVALYGIAALAQISYPLVHGTSRDGLTIGTVGLVAAAALWHAGATYGRRQLLALALVTILGGFAIEVLGVHTGVPFGRYGYAAGLGPELLHVPLIIAFAWTMLAWPAALVARRLCTSFRARVVVGAWALASWDVFLDPQMVAAGHWRWHNPSPHLPGVPSVPLTDYVGWLAVAVLVSFAMQLALGDMSSRDDAAPIAFYVWTWASSALGLAAFLGLPAAAFWGTVAMGVVALPLLRSLPLLRLLRTHR